MTTYAKAPKFRAAAKAAGIQINAQDSYSLHKLTIRETYTDEFTNAIWNRKDATGFEFYSLDTDTALKFHLAGFELNKIEVPAEAGTKRFAYIYRLAI